MDDATRLLFIYWNRQTIIHALSVVAGIGLTVVPFIGAVAEFIDP